MSANDRELAWAADQLEPDNWASIPEFSIRPTDVQFEGFAWPIEHPLSASPESAAALRLTLSVARFTMQQRFSSLDEIRRLANEAMETYSTEVGNSPAASPVDARSHTATIYLFLELGIETAVRENTQAALRQAVLDASEDLRAIFDALLINDVAAGTTADLIQRVRNLGKRAP